jgi:hypothetical protein
LTGVAFPRSGRELAEEHARTKRIELGMCVYKVVLSRDFDVIA